MDPQKLSQLDPKLRDAYQRVMGTAIPEPPATTVPPNPQQNEPIQAQTPDLSAGKPLASELQPDPVASQPVTESQPTINQQPSPAPQPAAPAESAQTTSANFTMPVQTQTMAVKKKSGLMPILFGIVGLIFLAIYTLFWTRIFNFKLPFLP